MRDNLLRSKQCSEWCIITKMKFTTSNIVQSCSQLYRLEEFEECYTLYKDVIKNSEVCITIHTQNCKHDIYLTYCISSIFHWNMIFMDRPRQCTALKRITYARYRDFDVCFFNIIPLT